MTDTLTAEKLAEIEAWLRAQAQRMDEAASTGNEFIASYAEMHLKAADALKAQAAKIERMTRYDEPPLTCPHIDRLFSTDIPDDIREELEAIRDINSQLRHGLWAQKDCAEEATARATAAEAKVSELTSEIDELRQMPTCDPCCAAPQLALDLDAANVEIALLTAALEKIRDNYANQDICHVDFRVEAYLSADAALGAKPNGI